MHIQCFKEGINRFGMRENLAHESFATFVWVTTMFSDPPFDLLYEFLSRVREGLERRLNFITELFAGVRERRSPFSPNIASPLVMVLNI